MAYLVLDLSLTKQKLYHIEELVKTFHGVVQSSKSGSEATRCLVWISLQEKGQRFN